MFAARAATYVTFNDTWCSLAHSHHLIEVDLAITVGVSGIEHLLELSPGLLWEWWEAVLLSESNDGIVSLLLGDGSFSGRQLFDNPVLDFLLLLIGQVLPFGFHELLGSSLGENVVDLMGLKSLGERFGVDVVESEGSSGSEEGNKGEEFHLWFLFFNYKSGLISLFKYQKLFNIDVK